LPTAEKSDGIFNENGTNIVTGEKELEVLANLNARKVREEQPYSKGNRKRIFSYTTR
jgi:hypothetical protein